MSKELRPLYNLENQNIFDEDEKHGKNQASITYHNPGELLTNSSEDFRRKVTRHYQQRAGANKWPKAGQEESEDRVGIFVEQETDDLKSHANYLRQAYEQPSLQTYTEEDLKRLTQEPDTNVLVIPYYNSRQVHDRFADMGARVWGLPPELVEKLKNKVNFHKLVQNGEVEGFEVPDYTVAHKENFEDQSQKMLQFSERLYQQYNMPEYPRGLMVRLEESDGNYGSALLRQERNGKISITPDGDSEKIEYVQNWHQAIELSKEKIYSESDPNARVVISRFLDLESTPGLSLLFMDGQFRSFGWNGQLQINGSKACVGTSNFVPKNDFMKDAQRKFEDQSAEAFGNFVTFLAQSTPGVDHEKIRGVANIDVMVPGPMEQELRIRRGQKEGVYVAECNPRWTNFTDAVGAGLAMTGREPTFNNFNDVIKEGIYSIDKYKLPDHVKPADVREEVFKADQKLKQSGKSRILVRMTDAPLGVILLGDRHEGKSHLVDAVSTVEQKSLKK